MVYTVFPYQLNTNKDIVKEFYFQQTKSSQAKILRQLSYLKTYGIRHEIKGVKKLQGYEFWEVRILGKENIRLFVWGYLEYIYVLHIFKKKSQKTKMNDLGLASKRLLQIKTSLELI